MKLNIKFFEGKIKNKINKSITWKLFIVTALVFVIFISTTLLVQSLFFEKFYVSKKKANLQNQIQKFKVNYNKTKDEEKEMQLIKDFEENNNAKIAILDQYGNLKFILKSNNEKADNVRIKAINEVIRSWRVNSDIMESMRKQDKTITRITSKKTNEMRTIVTASSDTSKGYIIFAISSLQPVNEASLVIKEFYFYFYIAAVILIIILSFVYSNMISKPLLKLNKAASKMAVMDFSEKCNIQSEDEIGNLSNTLNFLSENLHESLTSLKEANIKLEKDIEKERALERMRKEFVAAVSHELKTPISLIEGYAEGIKDGVFEGNDKDYYIDIIIDESKRMGNLVYDMLDLSQLESGNFKLVKEEFLMHSLIESVIKRFSALVEENSIDFKLKLLYDIKVCADWRRMEQVLINFITNAIKHTRNYGYIKIAMEELENNKVLIYVENNGKHIPEDEMNKIWDKFYKVDKSGNRKLGGTGIGLAIVKNILMLHGYEYGVKNVYEGVRFYFTVTLSNSF
ncbi:HAMP domain-containing protein [Clostridium sp. P21]|uniref:histidine kinase n=1 Tax=Clostridium muellerianum TaxID=2716538 RepID=A0A7Y0EJY0_9CLOT|nr:ATP-binding protein [Clostridium muellerianum]NMM64854.1 HAMP domain-containing protein [Clostridium muellerianum]